MHYDPKVCVNCLKAWIRNLAYIKSMQLCTITKTTSVAHSTCAIVKIKRGYLSELCMLDYSLFNTICITVQQRVIIIACHVSHRWSELPCQCSVLIISVLMMWSTSDKCFDFSYLSTFQAPRDSLDFVIKASYNHHNLFMADVNETLLQQETLGGNHGYVGYLLNQILEDFEAFLSSLFLLNAFDIIRHKWSISII